MTLAWFVVFSMSLSVNIASVLTCHLSRLLVCVLVSWSVYLSRRCIVAKRLSGSGSGCHLTNGEWGQSRDGCIRWGLRVPRDGQVSWVLSPHWFEWVAMVYLLSRNVFDLCVKFPYGQYIVRIYVLLAFRKYSRVPGRCWSLREICKKM